MSSKLPGASVARVHLAARLAVARSASVPSSAVTPARSGTWARSSPVRWRSSTTSGNCHGPSRSLAVPTSSNQYDAWVVGEEPVVGFEFESAARETYAKA